MGLGGIDPPLKAEAITVALLFFIAPQNFAIMIQEKFVPVNGYENMYEISNLGRVYSVKTKTFKNTQLGKRGYYTVDLWKNNKRKNFKIHRLIAIYFIPNPKNKGYVNHIDGDKTNNNLINLEWTTALENNRHARITGLNRDIGENHHNSKLKVDDIILIRELAKNNTHTSLSYMFNISRCNVAKIVKRETWKEVL